ncbi:archease [Streptomyces sp. 7R007]
MVGDWDDDGQGRRLGSNGHRSVPYTDDIRIDAWGASRERCMAEAVLGVVECFADVTAVRPRAVARVRLAENSDDDLLAALLEEVVHRLRALGEVPVDVEAEATEDGLDVRLAVVGLTEVGAADARTGSVACHELRIGPDPYGWSCALTLGR